MAIVIDNIYTKGISGRVGDTLLYKHYGHKTVVTAFPRLTNIAPSARQLAQRKKFAMAVLKTRQWLQQKVQKQFLTGLKNKWNSLSAYHAGIKYHMTQPAAEATTLEAQNNTHQTTQLPQSTHTAPLAKKTTTISTAQNPPKERPDS